MSRKIKPVAVMTAMLIVAFAFTCPAFAAGNDGVSVSISNTTPQPGEIVTFTINSNGNYAVFGTGTVTGPLTYVNGSAANSASPNAFPPVLNWTGNGGMFMGFDAPIFTLNFMVNSNAQPGEKFAINLTDVETSALAGASPSEPITVTSGGQIYSPPSASPGASASAAQSASPSRSAGASRSPAASSTLDNTPKTGDATTDVWMVLAPIIAVLVILAIVFGKNAFSKES